MTRPLARQLLDGARMPGAACGVAVAECFPDAPRVQAALREYRRDWADLVTRDTAAALVPFFDHLAAAHGLSRIEAPTGPAIGVATLMDRQTVALYDGRTWWACTPRGVCRLRAASILAAYEVA